MSGDTYFIRLFMIVVWQMSTVVASLYAYDRSDWLFAALTIAALVGPFVGYIAGFYSSLFLAKWRVLRALLLVLGSFSVTGGGYYWLYMVGSALTKRGYGVV